MFSDIKLDELPRQPYYQDPIKQLGTGKTIPSITADSSSWPAEEPLDLAA